MVSVRTYKRVCRVSCGSSCVLALYSNVGLFFTLSFASVRFRQSLEQISLRLPTLTLFNRGYVLWWNVRPDDPVLKLELDKFVVVISGILRNGFDEAHDSRELA